jgi:hypothetical protein
MNLTSEDLTSCGIGIPNLIVLGIHRSCGYDCEGKIWHQYQKEPISFGSLMGAAKLLGQFMDDLDFPQRAMLPRSFHTGSTAVYNHRRKKKIVKIMDNLEGRSGKKGTFIVQVMYRQNATWQGQVTWAEQDKKAYFRSALELMRLIDDAMNDGEKSVFLPPSGSSTGEDET